MIHDLVVTERSSERAPKRGAYQMQEEVESGPKRSRMDEYDNSYELPIVPPSSAKYGYDSVISPYSPASGMIAPSSNGSGGEGSVKLLIPARSAGAVIGKQGSGLQGIRQECGVRVDMKKQQDAPQWPEDRVMTVQGGQSGRISAVQAVLQAAFTADPSSATLKMLVSPKEAGAVIGKAGSTLKSLREQSGANVKVEKQEFYGERLVIATGDE